jgi:hypothetical protein
MYRARGRHEILQERRARRYRTSLSAIAALSREMGFVTRSLNLRISISAWQAFAESAIISREISYQRREAPARALAREITSSALIRVSVQKKSVLHRWKRLDSPKRSSIRKLGYAVAESSH